jgi:diguanylate cyclase (GGDEF)-like protein
MKRPPAGVWVGWALALLGLGVVVSAVRAANLWALIAALGGFLAATGLALPPLVRTWLAREPVSRPTDFEHLLDLLCRAHAARAAWLVGLPEGDVELVGTLELGREARRRGAALVQLASVDGRAHVARAPEGSYVAVGDFPFGAGLLLTAPEVAPAFAEAVGDELRRLVAGMRLGALREGSDQPGQLVAKQLAAIAAGAQTLDGIAKAGVTLAQQLTQRGAAIVLGGNAAAGGAPRIVAVSSAADGRLAGLALPADAPAGQAISSGVPVASDRAQDVFGSALPDRRRRDRAGMAYPLHDGHFVVGALVVMGPPLPPGTSGTEQVQRLVTELGSRLAAARAVYEAEQRAVRDPLTGLRNRREFDRALTQEGGSSKAPGVATLIYLDIDHFKKLNDTLGHAAGDAALRHIARILEAQVRDKDLVARLGGEEFAIWMPHTPLESGREVAERIRHTVAATPWHATGDVYPLTLSCGVAGFPDTVRDVANLRGTADAALYRAKQAGRNRVEIAPPGG